MLKYLLAAFLLIALGLDLYILLRKDPTKLPVDETVVEESRDINADGASSGRGRVLETISK